MSIGGNQEPWELKRKIAGRVALIGGLDQHNVLSRGPKSLIREKVLKDQQTNIPHLSDVSSSPRFAKSAPSAETVPGRSAATSMTQATIVRLMTSSPCSLLPTCSYSYS
jgi:hypothetical protein